jgi:hypothetical protein
MGSAAHVSAQIHQRCGPPHRRPDQCSLNRRPSSMAPRGGSSKSRPLQADKDSAELADCRAAKHLAYCPASKKGQSADTGGRAHPPTGSYVLARGSTGPLRSVGPLPRHAPCPRQIQGGSPERDRGQDVTFAWIRPNAGEPNNHRGLGVLLPKSVGKLRSQRPSWLPRP